MSGTHAHPNGTQLSDHVDDDQTAGDSTATVRLPDLDHDLSRLDFLTERDDQTREWQRALDVDRDDVNDLDRRGLFMVAGPLETHLLALVESPDGHWFGACNCATCDPCIAACAVHQLTLFDDDLVAEVSVE